MDAFCILFGKFVTLFWNKPNPLPRGRFNEPVLKIQFTGTNTTHVKILDIFRIVRYFSWILFWNDSFSFFEQNIFVAFKNFCDVNVTLCRAKLFIRFQKPHIYLTCRLFICIWLCINTMKRKSLLWHYNCQLSYSLTFKMLCDIIKSNLEFGE